MQYLVSEIFEMVEAASTAAERKQILNKVSTPRLKEVLKHIFNNYTWFIKDETELPEWYPAKEEKGYTPSNLYHEAKRFYIFYEDTTKVNYKRKQEILAGMLESIHPDEAQVLIGMLLKKIKVKGLTKKLVSEIWPDLITKNNQ